jgi:hypothetical protein
MKKFVPFLTSRPRAALQADDQKEKERLKIAALFFRKLWIFRQYPAGSHRKADCVIIYPSVEGFVFCASYGRAL